MAIDRLHRTHTGEAAPTTHPRHTSETRELDNSTGGNGETIANPSRRRLLMWMSGGLAVAVAGGGGYGAVRYLFRESFEQPDVVAPPAPANTAEARPLNPEDLTLTAITMPDTLNPESYAEVVKNVGQAVQFAVNYDDQTALARYIPGGETGVLLPDQFQLRAAFIDGYRHAAPGDASDPNALRNYPWGFSLEFQELLTGQGFNPQDERNLHAFTARVRVRIGDLPPLVNDARLGTQIEAPHEYDTTVTMTRWQGYLDANQQYQPLPNLPGQNGHGWGIANIGQMYPVPPFMTGVNLPKSFSSVPPIYNPNKPK